MIDFIANFVSALFVLGLPVGVLTWYIVDRLHESGRLGADSDMKHVKETMLQTKKDWQEADEVSENFFEQRWLKFGGGFYGLTAFVTFIAIEISEIVGFVVNFESIAGIFRDGILSLIISFFVERFMNIVTAFLWFTWWPEGDSSMFVWIGAAYAGYWSGVTIAGKLREQHAKT